MDSLSQTFQALADPTRRDILARLAKGTANAGELAKPFRMSQPAISWHLKVLREAGLIEQSVQGQWRPCSLKGEPLAQVAAWLESYRQFWDQSLARLDRYLQEVQKPRKGKSRGKN